MKLICHKCKKPINSKKDLAVLPFWYTTKPYHPGCPTKYPLAIVYHYLLRPLRKLEHRPINSREWTQDSFILGALGLLALVLFVRALIIDTSMSQPQSLFAYLYVTLVFLLIFLALQVLGVELEV